MSRSRIKAKTSYFLVTTSGKLRKLNLALASFVAIVCFATITFVACQCVIYNQRLIREKNQIQEQLARIDQEQRQLENDLNICLANKKKISRLLNFNTDSGKVPDEK